MHDDSADADQAPSLDTPPRYPLYCLDSQDALSESRYRGPFDTLTGAMLAKDREDFSGEVRRCRRVTLAEVIPPHWWYDLLEGLEELANEPVIPKSWARWDDAILVDERKPVLRANVMVVLSSGLRLDVFVCEGDETLP